MDKKYWGLFLQEKLTGKIYGFVGSKHNRRLANTSTIGEPNLLKYIDPDYVKARNSLGNLEHAVCRTQRIYDSVFPGSYKVFLLRISKLNRVGLKFTKVRGLTDRTALFRITHEAK